MTALNMQRAQVLCEAQQQATRPIFVVGIILNRLAACECLTNFLNADMTFQGLVNRVARKLKLTRCHFGLYAFGLRHATIIPDKD